MKKIKNPFTELDSSRKEYNCIGCSPYNEIGLKLEFWENGDEIVANWKPEKFYEGWQGVLHGGIEATLLDELSGWIVMIKMKTSGVTSSLKIDYKKPVFISKGEVAVRGKIQSVEDKIAKIECGLYDGEGAECATALVECYCFPERVAKAKYHYPGIQAFYE